ncbi:c2h2 finger domain-containing protein [Purpureocillium lilacinum]|uniref:C2h2 finger domain-containing protein n=1 Tax=Purpureocillium lilacinum TaxID=33203 RepID=A0A179HM30_PURLI|nr:c2h2 finger domain-containing protein [Purpureocillium lilacinum]OAQ83749.1 c2h2 finger domain-containing protein [Purpureocillium lilacinum]OAQ90529.1 c2h2 finger domain-containing protein [Purpureocillium lilacinum]PWI68747.1 hypothetical protein PCL_01836 [Purpureocillium lilacinum]
METPIAAFHCRLCDIPLATSAEFRQHAKSESHVYKLQCRVATPGTAVLPPRDRSARAHGVVDAEEPSSPEDESDEDQAASDGGDTEDEGSAPPFDPQQCLFCGDESDAFDSNVAHMNSVHSFIVPYQDCLAVDLETLIWYLHLVIYGYRECILCSTRRSTIEGIQQHMTAKGHCRFDISAGTEDFYELPESQYENLAGRARPDEASLRLPSGKLLSHRTLREAPVRSRPAQQAPSDRPGNAQIGSVQSRRIGQEIATRDGSDSAILAARLSQLSVRDQNTLALLPSHEIRSVLATKRKQLDQARRDETKARRRVERLGNKTLMKHFKPDVPGRSNG